MFPILFNRPKIVTASAFSPADIVGLVAWYDFSDISTLYQDSGKATPVTADADPIGAVENKANPGTNDATQGTTANKPTYKTSIQNGLSIARSDNTDTLRIASIQPFPSKRGAIFAVIKPTDDTNFGALVSSFGSPNPEVQINITNLGSPKYKYYDGAWYYASTFDPNNTWQMQQIHRTADTNIEFFRNATSESITIGNSQPATDYLDIFGSGGSGQLPADLGELLIYSDITEASRQEIETYLNAKWAIF